MDDEVTRVTIGGKAITIPPMTFYVLKRAWPHICRLGKMAAVNQAAQLARARRVTCEDPDQYPALDAELAAANARIQAESAQFVDQTEVGLDIIAAALCTTPDEPSADDLARRLRPEEFAGVHVCVNQLLDASGLIQAGETGATGRPANPNGPPLMKSNGIDSSPSWSPTA